VADDALTPDCTTHSGPGADPAGTGPTPGRTDVTRRRFIQGAGAGLGAALVVPSMIGPAEASTDAGRAAGEVSSAVAPPPPSGPPVDVGSKLTTNQGLRISDDHHSLKVSPRGPTLLEDFAFREKITHFDHERMPERVVHARGAGAHGVFRLTRSLSNFTKAGILTDTSRTTETFVRFSTVNGSRGSADTARDARGFATRFYTSEGVWDLVGNNIPVFFIQDAIKFPDLVHAFKPEPVVEIPQASTAHNNFWDYVSLTPESMHMIMWVMSDRALPRSFRMMQGFGVHTFRLVNSAGVSTYAKFHWSPLLGVHSLVWDEAQKLGGVDPDFHRRDLARAIDAKQFPQYYLGVQLLAERDVDKLGIDILDATKLWPEEIVPVTVIGQMTLDRNPYNYFAETEQVAYCLSHIVPGIDFTDDPLLQGRLFSYLDTQLARFHSANFHQLPINQSRAPVNNYQQDGFMRYANHPGNVNFEPSSLGGDASTASAREGGFVTYPEQLSGQKVRAQPSSFDDHFTQATLFFQSLTAPEQQHIIDALRFELGKVTVTEVKKRMLSLLANIDRRLVRGVAAGLGLPAPSGHVASVRPSPALSQEHTPRSAATRRVAILTADGADGADITAMRHRLGAAGVSSDVIAPHEGTINTTTGPIAVDVSTLIARSVQYDAVFVPGGAKAVAALRSDGYALHFIEEAYKHYKSIAATGGGQGLVGTAIGVDKPLTEPGVVTGPNGAAIAGAFLGAITIDRHWTRRFVDQVSA
jgi:catalase